MLTYKFQRQEVINRRHADAGAQDPRGNLPVLPRCKWVKGVRPPQLGMLISIEPLHESEATSKDTASTIKLRYDR
jgi:hypothetical protein